MLAVTLGTLRTSTRRYAATVLAIVLGVGFVATTLVLSSTLGASVRARISGDVARYAVVVTPGPDGFSQSVPPTAVAAISALAGVESVQGSASTYATIKGAAFDSSTAVTWPEGPTPLRLVAGMAPRQASQLVVSTSIATRAHLTVGSPVTLGDAQGRSHTLTVAGVVDVTASGRDTGGDVVFATSQAIASWSGSGGLDEIDVSAAPGTDPGTLRERVAQAVAGVGNQGLPTGVTAAGVTTRTGEDEADARTQKALVGTDTVTLFLLAFAVVALFVSALVIANTFAILVAQRLQQLALLRCVGATRRQVFGSVVAESVVVGLLGSGAGVALGIGAAAAVSRIATSFDSPVPLQQLGVSPASVVVPIVAGTLVTVVAAVFPAMRATRVAPLAALRPDVPASVRTRAGRVRLVVATVLFLGGVAGLVVGTRTGALVVAIPGGMVSFVGVLLASVVVVPVLVRVLGALPRRVAGVPGDLAVENAVRNRSRAAATSSALLVGVTLITMMSVAAASAQAAVSEHLSARYPVDAEVSGDKGALTPALLRTVAGTDGVAATVTTTSAEVRLGSVTDTTYDVLGVPTDTIGTVLRSTGLSSLAIVRPGTVVVDNGTATELGVKDGGRTTLGSVPVKVVVRPEPYAPVMAAQSDLARAGAKPWVSSILLRLKDIDNPGPVIDRLGASLSTYDRVYVDGAAPQRAELDHILSVVLMVVTGLLGVAVLIALVGVGNTLALSVLERGRESALVRALGLTRGQLRASLAIEAALLSLVGAVLGVGLGIGYGYAGAQTLLGTLAPVTLVVPWGRVLFVIVLALAAGVAAAWLPSRRAARVAPAAALAIQ